MLGIYKTRGFALPTAIFLLVILSIFAVGLLALNAYSQKSTINDVLDVKASFVAKTGIDYGAYLAVKNGACPTTAQTVNINEDYLKGFKFTYTCIQKTANEAGINQIYYTITSFGCNTTGTSCPDNAGRPSREDYVEKSLTTIVAKL